MLKSLFPYIIGVAFLSVGFGACNFIGVKQNQLDGKPVAKVFEKVLYTSDLNKVVGSGKDSLDSVSLVKNYIQNWVETQLLVHRAELNLKEDQKDFEAQLENYKQNLIIYTYEQELLNQKLNTQVSEQEIQEYYDSNKVNFELKDYVLQARWVKVDNKAPKLKKLRKAVVSDQEEDAAFLEDYCFQYASSCQLEKTWIYFDEFTQMVPIKTINVADFLNKNKNFEVEADGFTFIVHVLDFKLKNSTSPLELETEKIRNIILNKRKLKILSEIRKGLLNEGLKSNNVTFY